MAEPDGTNTAYTFDTQGNIMTKTVTHPASYEFAFTQNGTGYSMSGLSTHQFLYAYDKNNRLIMETEHVAGVGEDYAGFLEITKQNEYDNNGNLLKTIKGGQIDESVVEYAYNPLNQLTQYTDEEGAITSYTYNPDGLRNSKTQNGNTTKFYWDRGYMSAESIGGTFTAKNHIGATGVFARETATGIDYMLKNGHGDVTALVNNGIVTQTYDYDAYGVQKNINANDTNPFRYAGEYQDTETGLIYLRNRYYDNAIGRFITQDPIKDGLNWYAYCGNNPVIFEDPWGTYYIKDNGNGTYRAIKSPWYSNLGKVVASFVPYGDYITYTVEGFSGVSGGTSRTTESEILKGSLKSSLFSDETLSLLGEGAKKIVGKALSVYQAYETGKVIYTLGSVSRIDKISFYLMDNAGINTIATSIEILDTRLGKTASFIGKYSGYFTQEFRYGSYSSKTPYDIDMDLTSAKDDRALEIKINQYVNTYKTYMSTSSYLIPSKIESRALGFKSWLSNSSTRIENLNKEYKSFMGE